MDQPAGRMGRISRSRFEASRLERMAVRGGGDVRPRSQPAELPAPQGVARRQPGVRGVAQHAAEEKFLNRTAVTRKAHIDAMRAQMGAGGLARRRAWTGRRSLSRPQGRQLAPLSRRPQRLQSVECAQGRVFALSRVTARSDRAARQLQTKHETAARVARKTAEYPGSPALSAADDHQRLARWRCSRLSSRRGGASASCRVPEAVLVLRVGQQAVGAPRPPGV
jgi:hypothetical protein